VKPHGAPAECKKSLATSAASLPDSVWQRRAPGKFGIASNADLAEARGQQALQASFNKRQAREKWFNLFDPARFNKRAGSNNC